jgi:hypothetical protein
MEEILADHIIMLEERFLAEHKRIRKLAFDLAEKYKLPRTFNKEKTLAGEK